MKNIKYIAIVFVCLFCLTLSSCNKEEHTHQFVNGVCSCGATEPHIHIYENGVCSCGAKDPNYQPTVKDVWKFYIDDVLVSEVEMERGHTPEYPAVPENADEGYRWMVLDNIVDGVITYDVILLYHVKICHIQFVNQDGTLLKEEQLEWGSKATAPEYPENYSVVWDQEFEKVTDDMVIKGEINKMYGLISFYDGKDEIDLGIHRYDMGDSITLPDYSKPGYHFVGWFLDEKSLYKVTEITSDDTADFNFYAKFIRNDFSDITLPDATRRISAINKNGNYFSAYTGESNQTFYWSVSDPSVALVSEWGSIVPNSPGVCVLTATFKENPTIHYNCLIETTSTDVRIVTPEELANKELHVVTFKGMNGDIIDEQIIPDGYTAIHPKPLEYDGYAFNGWDKDACNITEDTVINATYVEGSNRFAGKSVAILGDSISTYKNHMPDGYAQFYPYPAGDVRDVNHTWWKIASNAMGTSIFINNAWGGTTVVGGDSATESVVRLSTLFFGESKPDIVIIFMGANDLASNYTNSTFKASYEKMIKNIQEMSPETEIILCTLLNLTSFYTYERLVEYNAIITDIAKENDFVLIDLMKADIQSSDLIDRAHPNKTGQAKIAQVVIEELRKNQ